MPIPSPRTDPQEIRRSVSSRQFSFAGLVTCLLLSLSSPGPWAQAAPPDGATNQTLPRLFPPADFTLELPVPQNRAIPAWLGLPEVISEGGVSTLAIQVAPFSNPVPDLAVTICFLDAEGSFLRVIWNSGGDQETLSRNLGEGVGTLHQRTLILSGERLRHGGKLLLSAPSELVPVNAVRFQWVQPRRILATADAPAIGLLNAQRCLSPLELSGLPDPPAEDTWNGWIITAPLIERIEAVEGGVDFALEMEGRPVQAALRGKLIGIRPGTEVRVFLNGKEIGPAALALPALSDAGYGRDAQGDWYYAGWREFSAPLPANDLAPGENTVRLHWAPEAQGTEPVSVKDLALELRYEPSEEETPRELQHPTELPPQPAEAQQNEPDDFR